MSRASDGATTNEEHRMKKIVDENQDDDRARKNVGDSSDLLLSDLQEALNLHARL